MLRSGIFILVSLLVASCGGRQRTRLGSEQTDPTVRAPRTSATAYSTTPPGGASVSGGGDASEVSAAIDAAARTHSMDLRPDPRLATLAEWIAERLGPSGDPPPAEVIDFWSGHLGLVEPTPHVMVLGLPDRASVRTHIENSANQFLARQRYTHWGATVMPRSGVWLIVVVLSFRHVELDPIPRTITPGAPIRVHGRLLDGYRDATIISQAPSGEVSRLPASEGEEFDVTVPTHDSGTQRVEVLARGPHGESVLANAPIFVGTEPPSEVAWQAQPIAQTTTDVSEIRRELFDRLNQTRREAALPALEHDPRLAQIALAHSEDMLAHDFVGHQSPTTGAASDRVRAGGVTTNLVLENIGRGYSAAEIHRGLLDSPGHRANLINPTATHVGIGVVADRSDDGRVAFLVTEVFIQIARPIDVAGAPNELVERFNRARTARNAGPLRIDAALARAAQSAAQRFFDQPSLSQQEATNSATLELQQARLPYRRLSATMLVVSSLEEAMQLEPAIEASVTVTGFGVAQGSRPDTGSNSIAVVVVLGWER